MGFQKILAGETDTNSPLNQALMDKIRENFDYLAENMLLACLDAEVTRNLGGGTWQTVKTGNVCSFIRLRPDLPGRVLLQL